MNPLAQQWAFSLSLSLSCSPKFQKQLRHFVVTVQIGTAFCPCHPVMVAWYIRYKSGCLLGKAFVISASSAIASSAQNYSNACFFCRGLIAASVQSEERSAGKKKKKKNLQIGTDNSLKVLMMKWKLKPASGRPDLNPNTLEEEENVRAGVHGYQTHALKTHGNEALGNRRYYSEQIHSRVH